jgi:putative transposase
VARRLRYVSSNGAYHVYNRAEMGLPILENDSAKKIFLDLLIEVTDAFEWKLHAYAIMSNHFHIVVTTPHGNLSEGMHRLQSSYANKHRAHRGSIGHVFQSRFCSHHYLAGTKVAEKIDYVHLNPVRAGVVAFKRLKDYPWCSYRMLWQQGNRGGLTIGQALESFHGIRDDADGWNRYGERLRLELESDNRVLTEAELFGLTDRKRKGLLDEVRPSRQLIGKNQMAFKRDAIERWNLSLNDLLAQAGKDFESAVIEGKSAGWKVELVRRLLSETDTTTVWLAEKLVMGSDSNVRRLLRESSAGTKGSGP